ncbi:MAG: MGMT family protein [Candidatus Omnitrophota bacterium]
MTPFARKVYKAVLSIPLGQVRTYKWVAQKAGNPRAFRAVGTILKNNPLPFLVPCHRVVKSDKKSGGYVFGIKPKKLILDLEKRFSLCLTNKE